MLSTVTAADRDEAAHTSEYRYEEIEDGLGWALDAMRDDDCRWIMILEIAAEPSKYVQVLSPGIGGLWAECVSNEFLGCDDWLSEEQCEELPLLGWEWPGPPESPNWHFHDHLLDTGTAVAGLLRRTLRRILGVEPTDVMRIVLIRKTEPTPLVDQR